MRCQTGVVLLSACWKRLSSFELYFTEYASWYNAFWWLFRKRKAIRVRESFGNKPRRRKKVITSQERSGPLQITNVHLLQAWGARTAEGIVSNQTGTNQSGERSKTATERQQKYWWHRKRNKGYKSWKQRCYSYPAWEKVLVTAYKLHAKKCANDFASKVVTRVWIFHVDVWASNSWKCSESFESVGRRSEEERKRGK